MSLHTVALAPERFQQLKRLADRDGRTLSDTIARFLDAAIAAGVIPDELPGWTIRPEGKRVRLAHGASGFAVMMNSADAREVGADLVKAGDPAEPFPACLNVFAMVELRRQGAGVVIVDSHTGTKRTVAANVGADIGRRLVRAAA